MTTFRGSKWNKWDLHVHTPCSLYQNYGGDTEIVWDAYLKDLENLPPEIKVIGINDYWFLDGYRKVIKYKAAGRLRNIETIFPVCEFRIKKFSGVEFGNLKRINLHVIFDPELDPDIIQAQFLSTLQTSYSLDSEMQNVSWSGVITKESLINLGNQIISKRPADKAHGSTSEIEVGFSNLNVDEERVFTQLTGNTFLKGKNFLAIGKTEWADLKWTEATVAEKKDIINKVHFIFTCVNTTQDFAKSKGSLTTQRVRDLLLDCSDAHNYSFQKDNKEILVKERIGNVLTWIKAEPTFEGLRQTLYEQDSRIKIDEKCPRAPLRKIENIQFNFPDDVKIKRHDSNSSQDLCIKNIKEIAFSNYFTCLIGGRGTGKSTIINLMAERLGAETDFFGPGKNGLYFNKNNKQYDLKSDTSNYVTITGTTEIEFVSQGKVEILTDGEELTRLIFKERVLQPNAVLQEYYQNIKELIQLIDNQIKLTLYYEDVTNDILKKSKESQNYESIINSINDPIYLEITNRIKSIADELTSINSSKGKYESLLKNLKNIVQTTVLKENLNNEYENRAKEIIEYICNLEEIKIDNGQFDIELKVFEMLDENLVKLETDLQTAKEKLASFFLEKGTSQESINDSQSANENLARVNNEITTLTNTQINTKAQIDNQKLLVDNIKLINESSITLIQESIFALNEKLKIKNENVSPIHYEYAFNFVAFKNGLFEEFQSLFESYHISGTSWSAAKDVLFLIEPDENLLLFDHLIFTQQLSEAISKKSINTSNNYVKIILKILDNKYNFYIYKYLIRKHLYNIFKYVNIVGYYGKRELTNCSFGQRCTAVIVTLLMTGVKPLIIDEPEAHLDNRLIADYLVDLIKEKKSDRQIIFATHNANFVINGDAELIHILEIPDDNNFTTVTSTTIENKANRDKLLKLEGGKDAFWKREGKLSLRNN